MDDGLNPFVLAAPPRPGENKLHRCETNGRWWWGFRNSAIHG